MAVQNILFQARQIKRVCYPLISSEVDLPPVWPLSYVPVCSLNDMGQFPYQSTRSKKPILGMWNNSPHPNKFNSVMEGSIQVQN